MADTLSNLAPHFLLADLAIKQYTRMSNFCIAKVSAQAADSSAHIVHTSSTTPPPPAFVFPVYRVFQRHVNRVQCVWHD